MRPINVVNPSNKEWARQSYLLWFGSMGTTRVLVYADSLDDAVEVAAEWLADNAPGHLIPYGGEEHTDLVAEVCKEHGCTTEDLDRWLGFYATTEENQRAWDILQEAEADLTHTEAGFLTSYEWGIEFENPHRDQLISLYHNLMDCSPWRYR